MMGLIKSFLKLKIDYNGCDEYKACINDLIEHDAVISMKNFSQHGKMNCLEHSINVSYCSYLICKRFRLDYNSAARGGLLHDLFLYDWHTTKLERGLHGFTHPHAALKNANLYFQLNDMEKDIIVKHMWPLTIKLPKYKESFVIVLMDKYCTLIETLIFFR